MMRWRKICGLLVLSTCAHWCGGFAVAQDSTATPSDKTKEAVDKFINAPASIGKSVQELREAAEDKLRQVLGGKPKAAPQAKDKPEPVELSVPRKAPEGGAPTSVLEASSRDPFRPMSLRVKVHSQARENLSPLERLDLSQLKVVGIIWDIKEPRAMVEDTARLGYVVKVGTPIGNHDGKVKAIHRDQLVIEEFVMDIYGVSRKRDVTMQLATE